MFVMIGVGMACGLGVVFMALIATAFVGTVLAIFDAGRRARLRLVRVLVHVDDPHGVWERIRLSFPGARALELSGSNLGASGRLVMETVLGETMDAAAVMRLLHDS